MWNADEAATQAWRTYILAIMPTAQPEGTPPKPWMDALVPAFQSAHDAERGKGEASANASDPDCERCRGGGCEWCHNTGKRMILMPLSDANDLDAVVRALGIED